MFRSGASDRVSRLLRRAPVLVAAMALLAGPLAHLVAPEELGHHLEHGARLSTHVVLGAHHEHDGPHTAAELSAVEPHSHAPCGSCLRSLREVGSPVVGVLVAQAVDPGALALLASSTHPGGPTAAGARPRGPPAVV